MNFANDEPVSAYPRRNRLFFIVVAVLFSGIAAATALFAFHSVAAPPAARVLATLDVRLLGCASRNAHVVVTSQDELSKLLAAGLRNCPDPAFAEQNSAFLRTLARARLDWSEEVLVIVNDSYGGTGMARPEIDFTGSAGGVLTATIRWIVPPPPVTPDTASCALAFAVRREVKRLEIVPHSAPRAGFRIAR